MKSQESAWQHWLDVLSDTKATLAVTETVHDHLPGTWRIDGMRIDAHINWFVLNSGIRGHIAGQAVQAPAGSWVCLAPGTEIDFQSEDTARPLHMMRFRLRVESQGRSHAIPPAGFVVPDASAMRPLAAQLLSCAAAQDVWSQQRRRGLLLALFAEAVRLQGQKTSAVRGLNEDQLQTCDQLIARYLPDAIAPQVLAEALHLKADTFARSFKRSRGTSPRTWIAERRIRHAAELLLMPRATVTQVADDCLYADVFHFSKQFSRVMGCSPRQWQEQHSHS